MPRGSFENYNDRHSGARVQRASPESITTIVSMDSGPEPQVGNCRPTAHPGMTPRVVSIARHLQITNASVAAPKTDRAFPIGEARSHPAVGIQLRGFDPKTVGRNDDAPSGRHLAAFDVGRHCRRYAVVGRGDLDGTA